MVRDAIRALCLTLVVRQTTGHGAVVYPPPRNAVDSDVLPWSGPVPSDPPGVESATGWCPVWSEQEGKISGQNGQACFWVRGRPAGLFQRLTPRPLLTRPRVADLALCESSRMDVQSAATHATEPAAARYLPSATARSGVAAASEIPAVSGWPNATCAQRRMPRPPSAIQSYGRSTATRRAAAPRITTTILPGAHRTATFVAHAALSERAAATNVRLHRS